MNTRLFDMKQLVLSLKNGSANTASLATLRDISHRCAVRSSAQNAPLLSTALSELVSYIDTEQAQGSQTETVYQQLLTLLSRIEQISMDPGASPQLIRRPGEESLLFAKYRVHILSREQKLNTLLQNAGYLTRPCDTLAELQNNCTRTPASAIIIDTPLDDTAAAHAVFEQINQAAGRHIPVIYLGDGNDMDARLAAARAGATRYFSRPLEPNDLIRALDNLTHRHLASPYRVLIVEPDQLIATFFAAVLGEHGIITQILDNPLLVLDALPVFKPDLLLTDIYMHGCSGLELAAVIRQDDRYAHMPIVFLSGEEALDKKLAAMHLGGDDFLTKPIDATQLLESVLARLQRARWLRRLNRELQSTLKQLQHQQAAVNAHAIVSITDAAGNIVLLNQKFCQISGYSEEELLGQNHRLLKSGVHSATFYQEIWDTISRGQIWHGEICNRRKNGELYWVESTITPMLDENGIPYQYVSIRTDITRLKQIESDIRTSEERLRRSQAAANIGSWDWNIQTGELVWSERVAPLLGCPENKPTTNYDTFINAVHPDDRDTLTRAVNACISDGSEYNLEHRVVRPDGEIRWMLERGNVVRDSEGNPRHMLGVVQDITDRKRLEQDLAQQKMLLALLQNALSNFVVTNNIRGTADFLLDGLITLTASEYGFIGEILQDAEGAPYLRTQAITNIAWNDETRHFYAEHAPTGMEFRKLDNLFGHVILSGEPLIANDPAHHPHSGGLPQGHPPLKAFIGVPIYYGKELVGMYGLANRADGYSPELLSFLRLFNTTYASIIQAARVTEQRQQMLHDIELAHMEAERANRAKSDFLSSMSHELRTPLNAILGFSQLMELSNPPLTPENAGFVQQILKAGHHLLELINEVLDLSKIESGRIDLVLEPVSLIEILADCNALVTPLAQEHGITLDIALNGLLTEKVRADRTRLRQVLLNLLSNAIKYNRPQGTVKVNCERQPDNILRIEIQDTGIGLTAEQQQQIFQPFNRLGMENSGIQGTGIGLSITRQLVEMMGGHIGASSQVGEGSIFWVSLPLEADTSSAVTKSQVSAAEAADYTQPDRPRIKTVLYIEDNTANLKLVSEILGKQPQIRLLTAHEPHLGISMAKAHVPDLILLDINLPGIDGYEVLQQLKTQEKTAAIPVIAVSAKAMPADIRKGLDSGFADYLSKPLSINSFLLAISRYIGNTKN